VITFKKRNGNEGLIEGLIEGINPKNEAQNSKQKYFAAGGGGFCFDHLHFGHLDLFRVSDFGFRVCFRIRQS